MLFSGALILVGAVAMTKFQRVYEAAVFKTLGASTRPSRLMLLIEYGVLGLLAGTRRVARRDRPDAGASAATRSTFRGEPVPAEHVAGVVLTAVARCAVVGVASSLDVLRAQARSATLRAE